MTPRVSRRSWNPSAPEGRPAPGARRDHPHRRRRGGRPVRGGVFTEEHPWAKDVGVVLNLDARGNSGPSYMFETSEGNGWLIEQLARALPHPMASSLTVDVYRLMPNDTDLTIYMRHGMPGLNFAFIGGLELLPLARGYPREPRPADAPASGREPPGDGPAPGPARPRRRPARRCGVLSRCCSGSWRSIPRRGWSPCWPAPCWRSSRWRRWARRRGRVRLAEILAGFGSSWCRDRAVLAVGLLWIVRAGHHPQPGRDQRSGSTTRS